ncbi:hypothetical protein [Celeribacter sp.]|uniref:hypothetical protein n=1 Tax=Celeribacter sp. TaxID=1890673 RepID=UPI003A94BA73
MSSKPRKIAVLTGDLVNSTGLGPENVERAFDALEACADMQADWMDGQSLHFTRHRGDGWQVALADPKYALRSALCFRAALRGLGEEFDSYIGIAEGEVPQESYSNLNLATFAPFILSGRCLELAKMEQFESRFFVNGFGPLGAAFILAEAISSKWTQTQSEAVLEVIHPKAPWTYTAVAKKLKKSRQAISKSLAAASFETLNYAMTSIEEKQILVKRGEAHA